MPIQIALTCQFSTPTGEEKLIIKDEASVRLAFDMAYNAEHRGPLPAAGESDTLSKDALGEAAHEYTALFMVWRNDYLPGESNLLALSSEITRDHVSYALQHLLALVRIADYKKDHFYNSIDDIARTIADIVRGEEKPGNSPLVLGIADGFYAAAHRLKTDNPKADTTCLEECADELDEVLDKYRIHPGTYLTDVIKKSDCGRPCRHYVT